ncbi:MAG: type II toxin-antitoxin system PemK/MazF family toxin [Chlamydiae bacterium]|nr:type II toxin-antitoxin system PemK/MazF family toxin [Chlamydiota bacterium]MBI3277518.1 type II toxin-antitoxin system PemK/MazF family toxin [Chlamydiota bacterium]
MQRGEIYWVNLDPVVGKETGKIRPCLIVSNNVNNEEAGTVTVLPITSKVQKVYPFEVLIKAKEGGLTSDSKVKANQIKTIDKSRIKNFLGVISSESLEKVEWAVKIHLGLEI